VETLINQSCGKQLSQSKPVKVERHAYPEAATGLGSFRLGWIKTLSAVPQPAQMSTTRPKSFPIGAISATLVISRRQRLHLGCNVMFIAQPPREWLFLEWREQIVIFLSRGRAKHGSENTWILVS
jgi:hypothetical protein